MIACASKTGILGLEFVLRRGIVDLEEAVMVVDPFNLEEVGSWLDRGGRLGRRGW